MSQRLLDEWLKLPVDLSRGNFPIWRKVQLKASQDALFWVLVIRSFIAMDLTKSDLDAVYEKAQSIKEEERVGYMDLFGACS